MDLSLWDREWDNNLLATADDLDESSAVWGWDSNDIVADGDELLRLPEDLKAPPQNHRPQSSFQPSPSGPQTQIQMEEHQLDQKHKTPIPAAPDQPSSSDTYLQMPYEPTPNLQPQTQHQAQNLQQQSKLSTLTESQIHARHSRELSEAYTMHHPLVESHFDEIPGPGLSNVLANRAYRYNRPPLSRGDSNSSIPGTPIRRSSSSSSFHGSAMPPIPSSSAQQSANYAMQRGIGMSPAQAQAVRSRTASFNTQSAGPSTGGPGPAEADSPAKPSTRRRISKEQTEILEKSFEREPRPSREDRVELVKITGLQPRSVQIWFQNRRAKMRVRMQQQQQQQQNVNKILPGPTGQMNLPNQQLLQQQPATQSLPLPQSQSQLQSQSQSQPQPQPSRSTTDHYRMREAMHAAAIAAVVSTGEPRNSPIKNTPGAPPAMMATPKTPVQRRPPYPPSFSANSQASSSIPPPSWGSPADRWYGGVPYSNSTSSLAPPSGGYHGHSGSVSGNGVFDPSWHGPDSPLLYSPAPTTPMSVAAAPIGEYEVEHSPYREMNSHHALQALAAGRRLSHDGQLDQLNQDPLAGPGRYVDLQAAPQLTQSPRLYQRAPSPDFPFPPYEHLGRSKSAVFVRNTATPTLTDSGAAVKRRKSSLRSMRGISLRPPVDLEVASGPPSAVPPMSAGALSSADANKMNAAPQNNMFNMNMESPNPPSRASSRESFQSLSRGRQRSYTSGSTPMQTPVPPQQPMNDSMAMQPQGPSPNSTWYGNWQPPTLAGAAAYIGAHKGSAGNGGAGQLERAANYGSGLGPGPSTGSGSAPGVNGQGGSSSGSGVSGTTSSGSTVSNTGPGGMRIQLGEHNNVATLVMVPSANNSLTNLPAADRPPSPLRRSSNIHAAPTPLLSVGEEDDEKNIYWPTPQRYGERLEE